MFKPFQLLLARKRSNHRFVLDNWFLSYVFIPKWKNKLKKIYKDALKEISVKLAALDKCQQVTFQMKPLVKCYIKLMSSLQKVARHWDKYLNSETKNVRVKDKDNNCF